MLEKAIRNQVKNFSLPGENNNDHEIIKEALELLFHQRTTDKKTCEKIIVILRRYGHDTSELSADLRTGH